jgi:hypothetical protein
MPSKGSRTLPKLLHKLKDHCPDLPTDLRVNIIAFYQDLNLPIATRKVEGDWKQVQIDLSRLAAVDRDLRPDVATAKR